MSNKPTINKYSTLTTLARKLRSDLSGVDILLIYAYNRTGKTRLSMEFKEIGKRNNNGIADTIYFNAYTEDLFTWENDLIDGSGSHLLLNPDPNFFNGLKDLALDMTIAKYLNRYADFDFNIDYTKWNVSFSKGTATNIKISRGEQNIFIFGRFKFLTQRQMVTGNYTTNRQRQPQGSSNQVFSVAVHSRGAGHA